MMGFLDKLSEEIIKEFKDRLHEVIVVFPNRRAGVFFQGQLAQKANGPIIQPEVITMGDFIENVADVNPIDDIDQILALYKIHKDIEGDKAKSLDEIMGWGHALLTDFNETDNYLADPEAVYKYLDEAKALSLWNPSGEDLTEAQQAYLSFYGSLINYYVRLREYLLEQGLAYSGLMYRIAVERVLEPSFTIGSQRHMIFAGFNALTKAEEVIIESMIKKGEASVYWDADTYYIEDPNQEAGHFLRGYLSRQHVFGNRWISDSLISQPKQIRIIGIGLTTAQALEVSSILSTLSDEEIENTAVVINDDKLLFPLLNLLPPNIKDVNLTMGLSLKNTPALEIISDYFAVHIYLRANRTGIKYHLGPTSRILHHPWLRSLIEKSSEPSRNGADKLLRWRNEHRIFISGEDISTMFANDMWQQIEPLFKTWERIDEGLVNLTQFVDTLLQSFDNDSQRNSMEKAVVSTLFNVLKRIGGLIDANTIKSKRTLKSLILRLVQRQSLRFSGEPLKGLQIMGMLETRVLDFDTVILTGVNEGLLPRSVSEASFIPYDVRHHFDLPMPREKEAMYAYHFYRLLQRSNNAYILYNTEVDFMNGGERSRYIQQIIRELPQRNKQCRLTEELAPYLPVPESDSILSFQKDASIVSRIKAMVEKGISASHLMTYLRCQVQFFYRYIAGLEEKEELEELMDRSILGSALHDVLQDLYSGMPDFDDGSFLRNKINHIPELADRIFQSMVQPESLIQGENYLLKGVSIQVLRRFLNQEIGRMQAERFKILELEQKHEHNVDIDQNQVRFKGIIDRVDQLKDGSVRVIDYKSGRVTPSELKVNSDELLNREGGKNKAFQLMFYIWLYSKNHSHIPNLTAGIHSLRSLGEELISLRIDGAEHITTNHCDGFEKELFELVREILDPNLRIQPTQDLDACRSCDYRNLCGRTA